MDARLHATSDYALQGAHRAVPCGLCHRELTTGTAAAGAATLRGAPQRALAFADPRRRCDECHRSPHGDQFAKRKDKGACDACHGLDAFAPASRFDHNRDAAYKLDGQHAGVACAGCHPTVKDAAGTHVRYRPIPSRCEDCHAVTPAKKSSRLEPSAGSRRRIASLAGARLAMLSSHAEVEPHVAH